VSRSQAERIDLIMERSSRPEEREGKKRLCWTSGREKRVYLEQREKYTLGFSRARGATKV
jgi:hypothetical protein